MTETHKTNWLHHGMLLASLVAGVFATRMVPQYQEHIGTVTYPSRAAASQSEASSDEHRGYSYNEAQSPKLTLVRSVN